MINVSTLVGTKIINNYSIELPIFSEMALESFGLEVHNLQIPSSIISLLSKK